MAGAEIALFEHRIAAGPPAGDAPAYTQAPTLPTHPADGKVVTYAHVAPLFARHCVKCHSANGILGAPPEGYRLTSLADTRSATERARVVPGRPEASELLRRIKGQARPRMPLDGPPYLSDADIQLVEAWMAGGARDPAGQPAAVPSGARVRLHGTLVGARWTGWRSATPGIRGWTSRRIPGITRLEGRLDGRASLVVERLRRR